ncbi:MAG: hypothetical protein RJA36_1477 [Pseudomonadota bacterium]|jgi:hypothetical protein
MLKHLLAAALLLAAVPAKAATIDVLVTFTPAAQTKMVAQAGSVTTYVDRMLENANRALLYTGSGHQLRVATSTTGAAGRKLFSGYLETSLYGDFTVFVQPGDGYLDQVHNWRNQFRGDVAVLIGDYGPGEFNTGIAERQPVQNEGDAFLGCDVDRCNQGGEWVFAHELGHLAGCGHESQTAIDTTAYEIPGTNIIDLMFTYGYPNKTRLLFYGTNRVAPNFYGMQNVRIGDANHDCGGSWIFFGNVMSNYR